MAVHLKVVGGGHMRPPPTLSLAIQSFTPGPKEEPLDLDAHTPRNSRHYLTDEEKDVAKIGLSMGLAYEYIIRLMFSTDPGRPVPLSSIGTTKQKAARLYLVSASRKGAKVSDVRRGMIGLMKTQLVEACSTLKDYHKKRAVVNKNE